MKAYERVYDEEKAWHYRLTGPQYLMYAELAYGPLRRGEIVYS